MKHGSFKAIRFAACLFWVLVPVFSSFGDDNTVQLESLVLENFNGDTAHEWTIGAKTYSYDFAWKLDASKFATKTDDVSYPQMTYVPAWPIAAFGYNRNGDKDIKSLGIHGRFDRRGYNWIDLYPVKGGDGDDADNPVEIPIPGRMRYMDLWVWGSNLDYYMEVYLRDNQGVVHNLRLGNLGFTGWRNLRVNIPTSITQSKRVLPRISGLNFVKFRIWTQPTEKVGDFYIYLKQFKVLTDVFESLFDGDELGDPDYVQELWSNASN
ncbi:MAG: flagellar filament outer layer protein FlaA [Treponema sp.]|nr:flagellar filament outer layer protein FlaA [Treponema sp.]